MPKNFAIGVDLGGTNIRIALGNEKGFVLARTSQRTEKSQGPEGVSNQIIRMIRSVMKEWSNLGKITGIGIGSTGPLDLNKGNLVNPTNIPFDLIPIVEPLEDKLKIPTFLVNDCSLAVVGEKYFGAGKGFDNLAYITFSTGIGGGMFVDNKLLIGKDGNATEVGHFTIDYTSRLTCSCGRKGHWEAYCSGNSIPRFFRLFQEEKTPETDNKIGNKPFNLTAKDIFIAAKAGDKIALEFVEKIGVLNAIGFATVTDAYDPSLITMGGAVTLNNPALIINPIKRHIVKHARNRVPKIMITPLRDDAVLKGALALVFHPLE